MAQNSAGFLESFTNPQPQMARELYRAALENALRWHVLPDPSFAFGREINVYELVRRDAVIKHVMDLRRHAVAGAEATVLPGGEAEDAKRASDLGQAVADGIENLAEAKLDLADAVFTGSAYAKIAGRREVRDWGDGRPRRWWVPRRLVHVDRRRVRWQHPDADPTAPHVLHLGAADPAKRTSDPWRPVEHLDLLVQHLYDAQESTLRYGRGLLDAIYVYWYAKTQVLQEGLRGVERWAQGVLVLTVDPDRAATPGKSNQDLVDDGLKNLEKTRGRHAVGVLGGDKVDLLNGPGEGHQQVEWWLRYLDAGVTRLVMGALLPSGGGEDVGSNARARVEQETSAQLLTFDRLCLEATLTRQVLGAVWRRNAGNLAAIGLGRARMPRVSLARDVEQGRKELADTLAVLLGAGVRVPARWAYDRLGIPMPAEGEPILEGRPPPDPAGLLGLGAPGGEPAA